MLNVFREAIIVHRNDTMSGLPVHYLYYNPVLQACSENTDAISKHISNICMYMSTEMAHSLWNLMYYSRAVCTQNFVDHKPEKLVVYGIYIIISKNIRYLLWNRGAWRFFHDTYLTIEVQGIRCTNHLHDPCPFTDVNPHFTAPGCRYYFKINSWWPIVTS